MLSIPRRLGFIKSTAGANITASAELLGCDHVIVDFEVVATAAAQTCTVFVYQMDTNTSGTNSTYLTTISGTSQIAAQSDVGTTPLHYRVSISQAQIRGRYMLAHVVHGAAGSSARIAIEGYRSGDGATDVTTLGVTKFAQV
jgi:hypothetical protein